MKSRSRKISVSLVVVLLGLLGWAISRNPNAFDLGGKVHGGSNVPTDEPERKDGDRNIFDGRVNSRQDLVSVLIKDLVTRGRPDSDSAITESEAGLFRAKNTGIQAGVVKVKDHVFAREVLMDRAILNASIGPCYMVEGADHFFFSGLYRIEYDEEGAVDLKFRVKDLFKWGWAVRKIDGEIFRWDVSPNREEGGVVRGIKQEAFRLEELDASN